MNGSKDLNSIAPEHYQSITIFCFEKSLGFLYHFICKAEIWTMYDMSDMYYFVKIVFFLFGCQIIYSRSINRNWIKFIQSQIVKKQISFYEMCLL
jgi:hypothetical protein